MRVSSRIIGVIKRCINDSYGKSVPLYLFGSRVDDSKKGGDIDIAIDCDTTKEEFINKKIKFVTSMISMGYDLKIDLVQYNSSDKLLSDEIKRSSILL